MILAGTLRRARKGYAGKHEKALPAGTLVEFDGEFRSPNGWYVARVVERPRVKVWVRLEEVEPA